MDDKFVSRILNIVDIQTQYKSGLISRDEALELLCQGQYDDRDKLDMDAIQLNQAFGIGGDRLTI